MNLDIIEKYVHLTPLTNGNVEVMFSGQPCLSVCESYDGGFSWRINPLFAKLTYGANIFEDVPYCNGSLDSVEEAIAEGLSSLNDLGAFHGVIDLPTDTYVEEHLDESVIAEAFSVGQRVKSNAVGSAGHHGVVTKVGDKTHEVHFALLGKKNVPHTNLSDDSIKKESVDELDEAVTHKELLAGAQKAYIEATRQGNGIMAKHYGAQILKHKANVAKQIAAAKQKKMTESEDQLDERADREDDEGYARTKKSDDAYNASIARRKAAKPIQRKTPEQEKAEWDKWVKECITDDCRKEALKHSDSLMEAQDLAQGLIDSVMDELDEGIVKSIKRGMQGWAMGDHADLDGKDPGPKGIRKRNMSYDDETVKFLHKNMSGTDTSKHSPSALQKRVLDKEMKKRGLSEAELNEISAEKKHYKESVEELDEALTYKQKLVKLTVRPVAGTDKGLIGKVGEFGAAKDLSNDDHYAKSLADAHEYGKNKFAGKYEITHEDQRGHKIRGGSLAKVRKGMNESLDEAALSGDAYWKAKEEAAKEAKAKEERAKMGIKEPVKKGRGKPTNIDLDFVHAAAKKNVEAGKRPTAGMERNEKIHFVRHLAKHPDFAEKHVAAAGRPSGTTKAAKAEKEVEKKKETSAFSMWAGLGKK